MFWLMVNIERTKIFKRAIFWIELALLAVLVTALYSIFYAIVAGRPAAEMAPAEVAEIKEMLTWPSGLTGSLGFAAGTSLGGILMIILVGAVTAQEYTWGTLHQWLSQGTPRSLFLAAKYISLLLPAGLIVMTALVVGGLVSAGFSYLLQGSIPFDQVAWGSLAGRALLYTYSLLPYAALTFFLAVISRSTVVSIGGGLAYTLLLEGIAVQLIGSLGGAWAQVGRYLPAGLVRGLLSTNAGITIEVGDGPVNAVQQLGPGVAAVGIALYILAFLGAAILVFRRQDLTV